MSRLLEVLHNRRFLVLLAKYTIFLATAICFFYGLLMMQFTENSFIPETTPASAFYQDSHIVTIADR